LKTEEGKKAYAEYKKAFTDSSPPRPELPKSRKKKEDQQTQSPSPPIVAIVSSSIQTNTDISNLFLYDTGAEIHVTNNINLLHNYTEA
jgi:hypothetical protein